MRESPARGCSCYQVCSGESGSTQASPVPPAATAAIGASMGRERGSTVTALDRQGARALDRQYRNAETR